MDLKPSASPNERDERAEYLRTFLDSHEELRGVCAASWQKNYFQQVFCIIGVSDTRLIFVKTNRKGRPSGDQPTILKNDEIETFSLGEVSGGSGLDSSILNGSGFRLKVKAKDGRKFKFGVADGSGMFGFFSGESQRSGAKAVAEFARRLAPPPGEL